MSNRKNQKKYFYIITNLGMPDYCKIGVTGDIEQRLKNLNKTSTPFRFQKYEVFDFKEEESPQL